MNAPNGTHDREVAADIATDLLAKATELATRLRDSNHVRHAYPAENLSVTLAAGPDGIAAVALLAHATEMRGLVDLCESDAGKAEIAPGIRAMVADVALTLGDLVALFPDARRAAASLAQARG